MTLTPFKNSLPSKIILMGFLILMLLIPLNMVLDLVKERETRRDEAISEVSSKWGQVQNLQGPILTIPFKSYYVDEKNIRRMRISQASFLPESLHISGSIIPETRSRGLYEVILYRLNNLHLSGTFYRPDFSEFHVAEENIMWDDAFLSVGIPDTRGIQKEVVLKWGKGSVPFKPGVNNADLLTSGVHARIGNPGKTWTKSIDFAFTLELQGSSSLSFIPLGKETIVELESSWSHPSFDGAYLPDSREVTSQGFKALWNISYFGRNYPQQWVTGLCPPEEEIAISSFGVKLYQPVDFYQKCVRAAKYGLLFISLTFLTFFLFEIFMKLSIHPLQYLLIGFALSIFYLLFLSLSEHMNFIISYIISSLGVIGMIWGYSRTILKNKKGSGLMALFLTCLYGYLFILLENQDYTLLLGSLALFIVLGVVMYITRNIDWYSLQLKKVDDTFLP